MEDNQVCCDEAIATVTGMNKNLIPMIQNARSIKSMYSLCKKGVYSEIVPNEVSWDTSSIKDIRRSDTLKFVPTSEWVGHIELDIE